MNLVKERESLSRRESKRPDQSNQQGRTLGEPRVWLGSRGLNGTVRSIEGTNPQRNLTNGNPRRKSRLSDGFGKSVGLCSLPGEPRVRGRHRGGNNLSVVLTRRKFKFIALWIGVVS